jgi:crotonobetainyl-CoA:carnitine CoA-transferase CaiB-like acyl-CoA transferase
VNGAPAALSGLRVVELTDLRGALAGRLLAELGADVLKVEPPGGDPGRLRPPFAGDRSAPDCSLAFLYRNAGKRGAVIDLEDDAGRARFESLCARADLLVENLGPAAQERMGLTLAEVRTRHPRLVHVSISDYGLSGPRAAWRLEPLTAFAASGALFASGLADRPPCWLPGYLAHDCASVVAAVGALAALLARSAGAGGRSIEISVQEAALNGLDPWSIPLADYARAYPFLPASVPRDGDGAYFVLPTRGGYVRTVAATPRQVGAFARLLWGPAGEGATSERAGRAGAASTHRGGSLPEMEAAAARISALGSALLAPLRSRARGAAIGVVLGASRIVAFPGVTLAVGRALLDGARALAGRALRSRPRDEVLRSALRLGLPMAAVHTPEEFVACEQTRARGYFLATGFPHAGDAPFAASPWRLSATPARISRPAPEPGEDDWAGLAEPAEQAQAVRASSGASALERPRETPHEALREPTRDPPDGEPPLAGLRVIDLGVAAVGPELCWILAELGAEVIKIESATHIDVLRRMTPELDNPNTSFSFNDACRGQKSVCLDLRSARGREIGLSLCAAADVVVENLRGGVARSWGLDYADVRRARPDVIYLSSQGYGRSGPLAGAPSFGPVNAAFAGVTWLWNHTDAPYPAGSSLNHPDHVASKLGAIAVLAALEHRRRTGEGQLIDMAQTEAAAYLIGEVYLEQALTGRPSRQRGNDVDYACPHGVYPCAGDDRWCAIAVVGDDAWERFRGVLGWEPDPGLADLPGRLAARATLNARVAAWTVGHTPEQAAVTLQSAGVSAMPVLSPDDLREDRHLAARSALVTVAHPEAGAALHSACPIRIGGMRKAALAAAPRLGEHTAEVLAQVLGLGPEAVAALVAGGVCR